MNDTRTALELPGCETVRRRIRLAFYGRVSTEDNQDPESSRNWQLSLARQLIAPHGGEIVVEFFDVGQTRALPWQRRPQANLLLQALRDPDRGFDAVVIGEPQRAFYGNQYSLVIPIFTHFGVQLWVPEVGGAINPDNEAHDLVMSVFGGMSKAERNRIKIRVRTAMASQTLLEGRYLGGRPPYGYALADLGPHPNPGKAAQGTRLHGLTPDPQTAPVVQRIYQRFLAGHGLFAIAEELTGQGIPCPSAADRARNRHRDGRAWSKGAIRVILTNPRYTGRQVWNKQRTDEVLLDVDDVARGHTAVMRWNDRQHWVTSTGPVHEALVDDDTFERVQELLAHRARTATSPSRCHRTRHPYVFKSLVRCGLCGRKMQAQQARGIAYYRCRYPAEYALANTVDHPLNVILREDLLVGPLDTWLAGYFAPDRRDDTINYLLHQHEQDQQSRQPTVQTAPTGDWQTIIRACDTKLTRYRAALDAGADPAVVTGWITETQAERRAAQTALDATNPTPAAHRAQAAQTQLTEQALRALIDKLGDIADALATADPERKAEAYRTLGMVLTYDPQTRSVRIKIDLDADRWDSVRVRGGIRTRVHSTPAGNGCACGERTAQGRKGQV